MMIFTSDHKRCVDIKSSSLWSSLFELATEILSDEDKEFLQYAVSFLNSGVCVADDAQITARQLELTKRRFAKHSPPSCLTSLIDEATTSCSNLFVTPDRKDLFEDLINLLKYADKASVDVFVER